MPGEKQLKKEYGFGILITLAGAILFSTKAIFVKLAFKNTGVDAVTLLALRMAFAVPIYLLVAYFYTEASSHSAMPHSKVHFPAAGST